MEYPIPEAGSEWMPVWYINRGYVAKPAVVLGTYESLDGNVYIRIKRVAKSKCRLDVFWKKYRPLS